MTEETSSQRAGFSIPQLRNVILLCSQSRRLSTLRLCFPRQGLSERLGAQVLHDLEWKGVRGAIEPSNACELAVAIGDVDEIRGCCATYEVGHVLGANAAWLTI